MRNSSSRRIDSEFNLLDDNLQGLSLRQSSSSPGSVSPDFPKFDTKIYERSSRLLARTHTLEVSEKEVSELHEERHALLDKIYNETASYQDKNRLEYVRWSLDRIDDAKYGSHLDMLEKRVSEYEHLLKEINDLKDSLTTHGRRK